MDDITELYLEIDDDYKHIQEFDVNTVYDNTHDDYINNIRISIFAETETIAYLDCIVFYDDRISESCYNHIGLADELFQDVYDAMELLGECSLLNSTDENQCIGF